VCVCVCIYIYIYSLAERSEERETTKKWYKIRQKLEEVLVKLFLFYVGEVRELIIV